jgi:uncharacterized protein with GYD domain
MPSRRHARPYASGAAPDTIAAHGLADEEERVPTYIMLSKLREQGLQTLRANPERIREVNKDVEELGARVLHQWFMLGPYDFVNIVEAPDAKTVARVSVAISARGSTALESYEAIEVSDVLELLSE